MRSLVADYDLVSPRDFDEVLQLLASGEGWRPIAGGTDLMVLFNAGKLQFRKLVSVRNIPDLGNIETEESQIRIGGAVTYSQIRRHSVLQSKFPLLCTAAAWTGGIANQNRGTLGGNIANASPAADSAPALLAYDAELVLTSRNSVRVIPYRSFHTGYKEIQLQPDEIISEIRLPRQPPNLRQYSRKVGTRKAQAISKICIAAIAELEDNIIKDVRIGLGSVAPIPLRCFRTEELLGNRTLSPNLIAEAQKVIRSEIEPISDIRSTDQYRSMVTGNLLGEFLSTLR
jgi:CO/xanthine dehydrogenase FAD-binding subunit